jgi:hypothetical protein
MTYDIHHENCYYLKYNNEVNHLIIFMTLIKLGPIVVIIMVDYTYQALKMVMMIVLVKQEVIAIILILKVINLYLIK